LSSSSSSSLGLSIKTFFFLHLFALRAISYLLDVETPL
jgi:hypothetical protein